MEKRSVWKTVGVCAFGFLVGVIAIPIAVVLCPFFTAYYFAWMEEDFE